jgi:UDP-N-acetylglucosamine--N-acetylmuramyl-(pentapeptide) pyrophosphoryl-undecaprenol N-acetylglucosamine transferase
MALVNKNAAILVKDIDAKNDLFPSVISLLNEQDTARIIAVNCLTLGVPNAAERIVNEIENII